MPLFERPYVSLAEGHVLWHVFSPRYGPTSFNPASHNRYAARGASPPRAMFYAGDTPAGALWETVLRDVVPDRAPPHDIELPPLGDLRIAQLKLRRTLQVLPLYTPDLRWIDAGDLDWRTALQQSTVAVDYTSTHAIAVTLLRRHPDADGLRWPARQASFEPVQVLYQPPLDHDAFVPEEDWALDSAEGLRLIDEALAQASMRRLDSAGLAQGLLYELPPDDPDPRT